MIDLANMLATAPADHWRPRSFVEAIVRPKHGKPINHMGAECIRIGTRHWYHRKTVEFLCGTGCYLATILRETDELPL